jgi:hypothetical protein
MPYMMDFEVRARQEEQEMSRLRLTGTIVRQVQKLLRVREVPRALVAGVEMLGMEELEGSEGSPTWSTELGGWTIHVWHRLESRCGFCFYQFQAQHSRLSRKELDILEKRQMFLHDQRNALLKAKSDGLKEGESKGRKAQVLEIARALLDVLEPELVAQKTGLSLAEVKQLAK